jgi:RimJ/RimL family protein N-acetyltransferase
MISEVVKGKKYGGCMYFKKMIGKRCYLSPIDLEDCKKYVEWLNDEEIFQYLSLAPLNISIESEKETLNRLVRGHNYGIIVSETNELIGNCGLLEIDHINKTAEMGIFIGNKNYLNKGYGKEAVRLLLKYSFEFLNLNNIMLRVFSFNERAIKSYKSVGFKVVGERRKALIRNNTEYNIIYMDILPNEYIG